MSSPSLSGYGSPFASTSSPQIRYEQTLGGGAFPSDSSPGLSNGYPEHYFPQGYQQGSPQLISSPQGQMLAPNGYRPSSGGGSRPHLSLSHPPQQPQQQQPQQGRYDQHHPHTSSPYSPHQQQQFYPQQPQPQPQPQPQQQGGSSGGAAGGYPSDTLSNGVYQSDDMHSQQSGGTSNSSNTNGTGKDKKGGLRRFKCEECGKSFPGRVGLVRHIRVHTGEAPFSCKECGKCFKQKGTLTSHMRIHTGEMPFECKLCSTKFRHRGNLSRHEKTCRKKQSKGTALPPSSSSAPPPTTTTTTSSSSSSSSTTSSSTNNVSDPNGGSSGSVKRVSSRAYASVSALGKYAQYD